MKITRLAALVPAAALALSGLATSTAQGADPIPQLHRQLCTSHDAPDATQKLTFIGTKSTPVFTADGHKLTVTSTSYDLPDSGPVGQPDSGLRCDLVILTSPDIDANKRFKVYSDVEVTADVDFGHGASDRLHGVPARGNTTGTATYPHIFGTTPEKAWLRNFQFITLPVGTIVLGNMVYDTGWEADGWSSDPGHMDDYFVLRHNPAVWSLDVTAERYATKSVPVTAKTKAAAQAVRAAAVKAADVKYGKAKKAANSKHAAAIKKAVKLPKAAKSKAIKAANKTWKSKLAAAKKALSAAKAAAAKAYTKATTPVVANVWTEFDDTHATGVAPRSGQHDFTPLNKFMND